MIPIKHINQVGYAWVREDSATGAIFYRYSFDESRLHLETIRCQNIGIIYKGDISPQNEVWRGSLPDILTLVRQTVIHGNNLGFV